MTHARPADGPGTVFRRILVPTDLTDRTEKALRLAIKLAESEAAQVMLLHVIETVPGLEFSELEPFYKRLEHSARVRMTALTLSAPKGKVEVAQDVVFGPRAEAIVESATAHGVDLVVLGSHRVNPSMVGRDWGTISYKVGILAQCPVLLVK